MSKAGNVVDLTPQWICVPSGVWGMKRLNLTYFLELGGALKALTELPRWSDQEPENEATLGVFRVQLYELHRALTTLLQNSAIPLAIPASRPAAQKLVDVISKLRSQEGGPKRGDAWNIFWQARTLETLLNGELAVQSVYHIWPKRAFDTNLLIDKATALFAQEVQAWFTPDETYNIEQAGKCIAFETPTAAGFHLLRATESVIRRYYGVVVGTMPPIKNRNWGAYLRTLTKCGGDPKILHAIEQIKDLHRNPVIHPEVKLSLEEAVSLIGITESIVSAIFSDMAQRDAAAKQPTLALVAGGSPNKLLAVGSGPDLTVEGEIPF